MNMRNLLAAYLLCGIAFTLSAQQPVAPPPKSAENGPSLEDTMKFIQDQLNEIGKVNYVAYTHDSVEGTDQAEQFSNEITNVVADPAACRIKFHDKVTRDGALLGEVDTSIHFRAVRRLEVRTGDQHQKRADATAGFPSRDSKIDPPVFVLVARLQGNVEDAFYFYDEDIANRVAKAMVHAVELCGGGRDPF